MARVRKNYQGCNLPSEAVLGEIYSAKRKLPFLEFVDLVNVCDSVPTVFSNLMVTKEACVDNGFVRVVQVMYKDAISKVRVKNKCNDKFRVKVSVHQG